MKIIKSVYVAGKMQDDGWRQTLFDKRVKYDSQLNLNPHDSWPKYSDETVCGLQYTGPFFVDLCGGHCYHPFDGNEHGNNIRGPFAHGAERDDKRQEVHRWCLEAIANADLIFAWIDGTDCYGTIAELGYAKALGKIIWIAGPRDYYDLWFVYAMADECEFAAWSGVGQTPLQIFQNLLTLHRRRYPQFDSPIEQAFWNAWNLISLSQHDFPLIPQYPIGKYRVDFAHVYSKTVIELDGHATHSSPDAIAYDRKRQREIEEQGWHVIRFGGKEVFRDAGKCAMEVHTFLGKRHWQLIERDRPSLAEVFPPDYADLPEPEA